MSGNSEQFESAIPAHLVASRTIPANMPANHKPPAMLYCARFNPSVTRFVILYVGVQFRGGAKAEELSRAHILHLREGLTRDSGPKFFDEGHCVDTLGYTTITFACYWDDRGSYAEWLRALPKDWFHRNLEATGPLGAFLEVLMPGATDLETSFSHREPEGVSHLSESWSGPTFEHTYWGSMRDRIPRSQWDRMEARGYPNIDYEGEHVVRVVPHDNLVVIRSGQDWSETDTDERDYYENDLGKSLQKGMHEISDGLEWGCFFQNHFTLREGEKAVEKTYSLSMWRSLKDLEDWTTKSSKHMEIFKSRIKHEDKMKGGSMIKTYHEVAVLRVQDQEYRYFNCHKQTRMLNAIT